MPTTASDDLSRSESSFFLLPRKSNGLITSDTSSSFFISAMQYSSVLVWYTSEGWEKYAEFMANTLSDHGDVDVIAFLYMQLFSEEQGSDNLDDVALVMRTVRYDNGTIYLIPY